MSKKLKKMIETTAKEYRSIPFWSWNDRLEPKELLRQIANMDALEMGGFFMHARGGLETDYMSKEWFDCVKTCIKEAKERGMEAWAYDENGWPSGFAGGKLLENPKNHALFIEGDFFSTFPESDENTLAIYALNEKGYPQRTDRAIKGCEKYLLIRQGADPSYVDTMRSDITDQFLEATHKEYQAQLGEDFGSAAMPGFFTDEPQYYRWKTPFSAKMEEWFFESYGYSVLDAIPSLFCDYEGAKEHRYRYHRMTALKFREGFAKRIYDWAEKTGIQITGHYVEESSLQGQMMGCGGIMPLYQYEHIPGIDYLGRALRSSDMGQKQLGSACAQLGKRKALSEMFGCCGWDVSPRELKRLAEFQYAGGVNLMCQHLYPYSIRGQRKRDYPAFYSEHNLWQKDLLSFNRYFNRLGAALSMGQEIADTLVIHPIHSAWLTYQRINHNTSVSTLNEDFSNLLFLLSDHQLGYHLGDETMMATLSFVKNNKLVLGKCCYKRVILPALDTLDLTTVTLLKEFIQNGGKIYTYNHHLPTRIDGESADLSFLKECPDICDEGILATICKEDSICITTPSGFKHQALRSMARQTPMGRILYLANLSGDDLFDIQILMKDCKGMGCLHLETLEETPLFGYFEKTDAIAKVHLRADESVILFEDRAPQFLAKEPFVQKGLISLKEPITVEVPAMNMLPLDRAQISLNGGDFSKLRPLEQIRDNLLADHFEGEITLSFPFYIKDLPEYLEVETEPFGGHEIFINGEKIAVGDRPAHLDPSFSATDITTYVQTGENRIEMKLYYHQREEVYYALYGGVSETLRNCLVFDTELENIYLFGHFALETEKEAFEPHSNQSFRYQSDQPFSLIRPKEKIDISNIITEGYPFYCGKISFSSTLNYQKGDPTLLHLKGRYATAKIEVNNTPAANLLLSEYADLADFLKIGKNTITITLCNNYRNLLGPHHTLPCEMVPVSPRWFSFEKKWDENKCEEFNPRYSFMRFGIDKE